MGLRFMFQHRSVASAAILIIVAAFGVAQIPTEGSPLPIEAVLSTRSFPRTSPSLSPNDRSIAYCVQDPARVRQTVGAGQYFTENGTPVAALGTDVWMTDLNTGRSSNITGGVGANWGPVWSPDGRYLAFYSDRNGKPNVWVYDEVIRSLRTVSDVVVRPIDQEEAVRWTHDSAKILTKITALEPSNGYRSRLISSSISHSAVNLYQYPDSTAETAEKPKVRTESVTDAYRADLALVDLATGQTQRIAQGFNPTWYAFSPDDKSIAFASRKGLEGGNEMRIVFELAVADRNSGVKVIDDNVQQSSYRFSAAWSPDGKWLSYITTEGGERGIRGRCFVFSAEDGTVRKMAESSDAQFSAMGARSPVWSSNSRNLYLLSWDNDFRGNNTLWSLSVIDGQATKLTLIPDHELGTVVASQTDSMAMLVNSGHSLIVTTLDIKTKQSGFYAVDVSTGAFHRLLEEDRRYGPDQDLSTFASADNHFIIYMAQDAEHTPNLWAISNRFDRPKQVTDINPQLAQYRMGQSRLIEWFSLDGERLRGAVLLPEPYDEKKKYPMIVWVYGGLSESDYLNYFGLWPWDQLHNMQLFATRGYAVLFPDSRTAVGTPMVSLAKSILPGVNKAIEMGIADPERIGVMGESFGGYTTLSLITQTTRFKAAISLAGDGNLLGLYGEMDSTGATFGMGILENGQGMMAGTPWEARDRYIENSPFFYLDRVQTPLLIIHGSEDTAVAPFLADEIFVGLRRLRKEVLYVKYEGEGHGLDNYDNRVDCSKRIIAWFDKHLKDEPGLGQRPSSSTQNVH
jgi:dipeptidyl aminopeptidase/acylaminoacyl peptidase